MSQGRPRRLLNHLANPGSGAAPAAIAAPGVLAPALARPAPPAAAEPQPPPPMMAVAPTRAPPAAPARHPLPPAAAAETGARAAPDGGGDLTLDQVRPLLLKALKLPMLRSKQPTIGGSLSRMGRVQRIKNCGPMTAI